MVEVNATPYMLDRAAFPSDIERSKDVMAGLDLLPDRLTSYIKVAMDEHIAGYRAYDQRWRGKEGRRQYQAWQSKYGDAEDTEAIAREMVGIGQELVKIFEKDAKIPDIVERVSVQVCDTVAGAGPESTQERDRMLLPWKETIEQVTKAQKTLDVVTRVRNALAGRQSQLVASFRNVPEMSHLSERKIVEWAYLQQLSGKEANPRIEYSDFESDFKKQIISNLEDIENIDNGDVEKLMKRDPLLVPWLYMVLTGESGTYMDLMSEKLMDAKHIKPEIDIGVATEDLAYDFASRDLVARKKNKIEEYADAFFPDGKYPSWLKKIVQNPIQRKIEILEGSAVSSRLDQSDEAFDYVKGKLHEIAERDPEVFVGMDRVGEPNQAVWLRMTIDVNQDLMGGYGIWSAMIQGRTNISQPKMNLSVPLSIAEAQALMDWVPPEGIDKDSVIRRAIIQAHMRRSAGISTHAGFGGLKELYSTDCWAEIAYNLSPPTRDKLVTPELLKTLDRQNKSAFDLGQDLAYALAGRLTMQSVDVMGSGGTIEEDFFKDQDNPSSMVTSAAYMVEMQRVMGLVEQGWNPLITVDIGHSMSGQITKRSVFMRPHSVNEYTQYIALTPVATAEKSSFSFLNQGMNKLFNMLISLNANKSSEIVRKFGSAVLLIGKSLMIRDYLLKKMTYPVAKSKRDFEIGRMIATIHAKTLHKNAALLRRQRTALTNPGENRINELNRAIGMMAGECLQVLIGMHDTVLKPNKLIKAYRRTGRGVFREKQLDFRDKKSIHRWLTESLKDKTDGLSSVIEVDEPSHYFETTEVGRETLIMALMRALRQSNYGSEVVSIN